MINLFTYENKVQDYESNLNDYDKNCNIDNNFLKGVNNG